LIPHILSAISALPTQKGKYHFRIISIQVSRREIAVYLRYFEGLGVEHFEYFC